ncbi:MAG: hypothetical protein RLZZ253_2963, partial [Verrucomicrobiota bacterium]
VHEVWGHFAAEFEAGLGDESGEPWDPVHGLAFLGQIVHGSDVGRELAVLDLGEIGEPDALDFDHGFEPGFTPVLEVVYKIKKLLAGASDGLQKRGVFWGKHGARGTAPGIPSLNGAGMDGAKLGFPVRRWHVWKTSRGFWDGNFRTTDSGGAVHGEAGWFFWAEPGEDGGDVGQGVFSGGAGGGSL